MIRDDVMEQKEDCDHIWSDMTLNLLIVQIFCAYVQHVCEASRF